MKTLILGCGYLGKALGSALIQEGHEVTGWVYSPENAATLKALGITPIVADLTEMTAWEVIRGFDGVVHCASSRRGDAEVYEKIYLGGVRLAIQHLPKSRLIFVSSTSVYAQTDGSWVDETSPTEPTASTGKVLLEAERETLAAGGIVVRAGGIYGPDRGVLYERFLKGEAIIEGDGLRWMNQIHRDDLASAISRLTQNRPSESLFNAVDDEPTNALTYFQWLSDQLKKPMPPFGPENHQRKRGWTHKRISNQRLRATGWIPKYPTFREGLVGRVDGLDAHRAPPFGSIHGMAPWCPLPEDNIR